MVSPIGMALLMVSAGRHWLPLFMTAIAIAGIAYSLLVLGGLALINAKAPADRRAAPLSAVYVIAYLMLGAVSLSLGLSATTWGLETGTDLRCCALSLACLTPALPLP